MGPINLICWVLGVALIALGRTHRDVPLDVFKLQVAGAVLLFQRPLEPIPGTQGARGEHLALRGLAWNPSSRRWPQRGLDHGPGDAPPCPARRPDLDRWFCAGIRGLRPPLADRRADATGATGTTGATWAAGATAAAGSEGSGGSGGTGGSEAVAILGAGVMGETLLSGLLIWTGLYRKIVVPSPNSP